MGRPVLLRHPSSLGFSQDAAMGVPGLAHPERAERIEAVEAELERHDWLGWERVEAPAASEEAILGVHPPAYLQRLREAADAGGVTLGDETHVSAEALDAAVHAAGAACALADALLAGAAPTGFALVRPPGHHADGTKPMGFCLLDNVAIAARHALAALGAERVMIVDWDVHHGNGTNDVFRTSDEVLFADMHQDGLFPGSGAITDAGAGPGEGYTINLPVAAGTDPEAWLSLIEHVVVPAGEAFRPQLILISAGFDAHRADPSADQRLEDDDFAELARQVRDLGRHCGAPVGAVLEGGYVPEALAGSVVATMRALAGEGEAGSVAPDPVYTQRAASFVGHHWEL